MSTAFLLVIVLFLEPGAFDCRTMETPRDCKVTTARHRTELTLGAQTRSEAVAHVARVRARLAKVNPAVRIQATLYEVDLKRHAVSHWDVLTPVLASEAETEAEAVPR